jgi:hypothetical protein
MRNIGKAAGAPGQSVRATRHGNALAKPLAARIPMPPGARPSAAPTHPLPSLHRP